MKSRIIEFIVVMSTLTCLMVACGGAERLSIIQTVVGLLGMLSIPKIALMKGWLKPYDNK